MSADNYIYVRKRRDGKYGVSHRFASGYYEDEGWTVEELQADRPEYVVDESWIIPYRAEKDIEVYPNPGEAILAAHRMYDREAIVEYGVRIAPGVLSEASYQESGSKEERPHER